MSRQIEFKKIKGEISALIILTVLAVVLGWLLINWNQLERGQAEGEAKVMSDDVIVGEEAEEDDSGAEENKGLENVALEERQIEEVSGKIVLSVKGGSSTEGYDIPVEHEITVAELMAEADQTTGLEMEYEDYGGSLGWFIKAINGLANGDINNYYWYFYVNGELGEVGVSNYHVKPGDVVEWRFEAEKAAVY